LRKAAAAAREKEQALRNAVKIAEGEMAKLTTERSAIERAMFDPATAEAHHAKLSMTDLMKLRASVADAIEAAEAKWVKASEGLEVPA
jgi:ATP-binding cassette subfamily F protein 3